MQFDMLFITDFSIVQCVKAMKIIVVPACSHAIFMTSCDVHAYLRWCCFKHEIKTSIRPFEYLRGEMGEWSDMYR